MYRNYVTVIKGEYDTGRLRMQIRIVSVTEWNYINMKEVRPYSCTDLHSWWLVQMRGGQICKYCTRVLRQ